MTNLIKVNPNEFGIEESKAAEMTIGLTQILAERTILSEQYASVITLELVQESMEKFKELRLRIRDNRTKGIEAWHKVNKEFYLRGGQFVDAIKRKEAAENERMEDALFQCEKHFENLEKERIAKLKATREAELLIYEVENLASIDLATMNDEVYEAFKNSCVAKYEAKKELERKAEQERIEREKSEAEERERIRLENERLKSEAEQREKKLAKERKEQAKILAIEREKAEQARKEAEELARIEREKKEAELAKERAEKAKIEAELKAKKDAEFKEQQEKEATELKAKKEAEKLAKAPIKKQLSEWVKSFEIPKTDINHVKQSEIEAKFISFKTWALNQIESM